VVIHGFVEGEIRGRRRIHLSSTARVVGSLHAPAIEIDFGAKLEGSCTMSGSQIDEGALRPHPALG